MTVSVNVDQFRLVPPGTIPTRTVRLADAIGMIDEARHERAKATKRAAIAAWKRRNRDRVAVYNRAAYRRRTAFA